ncbi:peptidylprolyl isomerase [Aureisphaera sp. CAU 1614]|uniref:Peptidylprolyl isomerase n=1 Tax=Halomarinibacterium sedimenti TaxID=2857106 RepID=A0A9X1FN61_9FLAO|nr:peptidylprolyl isomerase [Halomarinibacterium sedimenti]MBW2937584.1 peptidylprolyl isomerase [Halomarinibacterium sedimenti]
MKRNLILSVIIILFSLSSYAQKDKEALMTINNEPIYAKEFKRVYKKNLELVQEESQKSVDGYLDLFIDYKMKVAEAYAQNLHKNKEYVKDFGKYEEQLSRNYIFDTNITEEIIKEAYNRSLEEVEASHILIKTSWDSFPQDTLVAYNKIEQIRKRALAGEDFNELAKKTSEEPGSDEREGRLGYFSAFDMVYPFESEAYNTPVGGVSNIIRTQFGYHIIKVTDRRKKAAPIVTSHIMVSTMKDTSAANAKDRINEIYGLLQQGESFEDLAKQYSDDKATGLNGGKMRPFSKGQLKAPPFEEAAYSLKNPGDISKPVQTRFGWHIIRLEEKLVIPSYEDQVNELEKTIKGSDRLKSITSAVNNKIKKKYGFESYDYLPFFETFVTDSILKKKWKYTPLPKKDDRPIFKIGEKVYRFNDFAAYLSERQPKLKTFKYKGALIEAVYDEFETNELKDYFKQNLEMENEEYAGIIQEYRDGLLIFEVMAKNVWNKAKNDTLGQKAFYEKNLDKYKSQSQLNGAIFTSSQEEVINQVADLLNQGVSPIEIKEQINTGGKTNVLVTLGYFDINSTELPKNFELKEGVSEIYRGDTTFTIVKTNFIAPPRVKGFNEVKGRVMSDFQNELEKEWIKSLKEKYTVKVNEKALKKLKKELGS